MEERRVGGKERGGTVIRWIFTLLAVMALSGCESKRAARERAREAYIQGQQQELARDRAVMLQQDRMVTLQGEVENPAVPWREGLTLTQAIVAAKYTGFMNPSKVRVVRAGNVVADFFGVDLLRGRDAPLQPGDVIVLTP